VPGPRPRSHPEIEEYVRLVQLVRARERRGEDPNGAAVSAEALAREFSRELERWLFVYALTGRTRSCLRRHTLTLETLGPVRQLGRLGIRCRLCHRRRARAWALQHHARYVEDQRRRRERQRGSPALTHEQVSVLGRAAAADRWREIRLLKEQLGNALELV